MNGTKNVKFEKEANEDKGSTSQAMATEDPQDITKIALTLAKDAITAAVKSAEGSKPVWVPMVSLGNASLGSN